MKFDYSEDYSIEAEVSKAMYLGKEYTCFIEGKDDINFWQFIFNKIGVELFYLKELEGIDSNSEKAEEKIRKIEAKLTEIRGEKDYLICLDKDFRKILSCMLSPEYNVVYTYGYSIENTICCKETAKQILKWKLRIGIGDTEKNIEIDEYVNELFENIREFEESIILDILNRKKTLTIEDNQEYSPIAIYNKSDFITTNKLIKLPKERKEELEKFKIENFKEEEVEEIRTKIDEHINFFRGHFLQTYFNQGIEKKLKEKKVKNIGHDDIFLMAMDKCMICSIKCDQIKYYDKKIKTAYLKLKLK